MNMTMSMTTTMVTGTTMTTSTAEAALKLAAWLSPAFPVGGFSYSHGLEWAIEDGTVRTAADLGRWLDGVLRHGAGRNDAILFVHAHALAQTSTRASSQAGAETGDAAGLADLLDLAAALQPSRERHLEATGQGAAFIRAVVDSYPNDRLTRLLAAPALGRSTWTYAAAVAAAAACHAVPVEAALPLFLQAFAANVVSAGVRAVPLGQTDGLRLVAALAPTLAALTATARAADLDDLGGAAIRADIASMRHETQYTRLFRT
jgi:urease accessory protein